MKEMKRPLRSKASRGKGSTAKPLAIDLFSGSGGLTLGLRQAGFRVVAAVEIDPLSSESYKKNHRKVRVWEKDIRKLRASTVMKELGLKKGELDLLAGCPPCQGFSTIRTRRKTVAAEDDRNALIEDFVRFVRALLPRAIMLENVPGLAGYEGFFEIMRRLEALDYRCTHGVFDAAHFGVPQRRKRLVLVGSRSAAITLAEPEHVEISVREALRGLPPAGSCGDALHDVKESRSKRVTTMIGLIPKDGGSRAGLPKRYRLHCHKDFAGFRDVYGRMAWDEVAPTITGGCANPSKGRFLHPEEDRAITLREAATLQGFPAQYFFSMRRGKYQTARLIGNAFPPEFARRFAAVIYDALRDDA